MSISVCFTTKEREFTYPLTLFDQILNIPCYGACLYTNAWSLETLPLIINDIDNYPYYIPLVDPLTVHQSIFLERTVFTRTTKIEKVVNKDPCQMELNKLHPDFKKWEKILCENYMVNRMVSTSHRDNMVLPYAMPLTRLFRLVGTFQPNPFTPDYSLTPHVMVPLSEEIVKHNTGKGKRAHPPTDSPSSKSNDPSLPSTNLSPRAYIRELTRIENTLEEFKQSKIAVIMEYLVKIIKKERILELKRRNMKKTNSDIQCVVSIKEDTAYLCLHFTKDHEGNKIQYAISREDQYAVFKL
ncbi:hypothetical protein Tco_1128130 [Tanacetum coccineum]